MSADHAHQEALAHEEDRKHGPADIGPVERRYARRLRGAWGRINAAAREGIIEIDIFGLQAALAAPPRPFRFSTDSQKIESFRQWLRGAEREEFLEIIGRDNNEFVDDAYGRGIRHADRELQAAGMAIDDQPLAAVFNMDIHEKQLQTLYTRNFQQLEGMTDAVDQQISRELSEGLVAGENPKDIARRVSDTIQDVGRPRATTLARTELSNSHNSAAARRYQQHGVDQVEILVHEPCPTCQRLKAGGPYPAEQAAGLLPGRTHPNCVCSLAPVVT